MAAINIDGLTKHFADGSETVVAVDDLDLTVDDGDFVVLVGPSGCGKTTTLRCIAGLETVTEGEIRLGDESMTGKPPESRDIAMVFQSYALYPHMTVRDNMGFGLKHATDLSSDEVEARIADTAEMMGIGELLDRTPEDLSGGQRQRVALGRAIVRDPEAFLMDEPLSNLDAKLRAEMRTYLQQLQEDLDVTTIYVTHDQTEAMTMGDKIAILDGGRLQQYGTPSECYHQPENTFVAEFLGEPSINLFEMSVEDGVLGNEFVDYGLDDEMRANLPEGGSVIAGVRPESLRLSEDPTGEGAFEGEVIVVEHLGKETNIYLTVGDDTELTAIVEGQPTLSSGDSVTVDLPRDAIHVFDEDTGTVLHNATHRSGEARFEASTQPGSAD